MRAEILIVLKDSMVNAGHCLTQVGSTNGNQQAQSENFYLRRRKKNHITAFKSKLNARPQSFSYRKFRYSLQPFLFLPQMVNTLSSLS